MLAHTCISVVLSVREFSWKVGRMVVQRPDLVNKLVKKRSSFSRPGDDLSVLVWFSCRPVVLSPESSQIVSELLRLGNNREVLAVQTNGRPW